MKIEKPVFPEKEDPRKSLAISVVEKLHGNLFEEAAISEIVDLLKDWTPPQ